MSATKPRRPLTASMDARADTAASTPKATWPGLVVLYSRVFEQMPGAFLFGKADLVVGRDPESDIVLPDAPVSSRHARIRLEGPGGPWVLSDEGSRNGIFVDGELVTEPVVLQEDQVIVMGDSLFKFVEAEAEGFRLYRIDGAKAEESEEDAKERYSSVLRGGFQMQALEAKIDRIAPSNLAVLVLGETGVGKELVAERIHTLSRRTGPLWAVNCAAIPDALVESQLFGHVKGAFTGATQENPGHVRSAHKGSLFLDEIGDMPLAAQAKLLRVLETGQVVPVGSYSPINVDVRVIAATNQNLREMVSQGRFRADLLARLNGQTITIPPLSKRKEDSYLLAHHFMRTLNLPPTPFGSRYMVALLHYDFPGNVRELKKAIHASYLLGAGNFSDERYLSEDIRATTPSLTRRPERSRQPAPTPLWSPDVPDLVPPEPRATDVSVTAGPGRPLALDDRASPLASPLASPPAAPPLGIPSEQVLRDAMEECQGYLELVGTKLGRSRGTIDRWLHYYNIERNPYRKPRKPSK